MKNVNLPLFVRDLQSKKHKRARLQQEREDRMIEAKLFLTLFSLGFISCGLLWLTVTEIYSRLI